MLPAGLSDGLAVCLGKEPSGVVIAAVALKIGRVHVKDHFVHHLGIRPEAPCADGAVGHQFVERLRIGSLAPLEMDVELTALRHNVRVAVMGVPALVVALPDGDARFPIRLIADDRAVNFRYRDLLSSQQKGRPLWNGPSALEISFI